MCFKGVSMEFLGCFKEVSRECPWYFEGISRVFHGSGKGVLRVSGMFQGHVYLGVVNHPRKCY